ncbi:MAG: glycosyltransferase [Planctomycetota bacterium]|nr:MAG: glycosyltransferase [Planctomycetota bacterium]
MPAMTTITSTANLRNSLSEPASDAAGPTTADWVRELESTLRSWRHPQIGHDELFAREERKQLSICRRRVSPQSATVAFVSYENPFGRAGGVFAVADNQTQSMRRNGRRVLVLSPLHSRLRTAPTPAHLRLAGQCEVPFGAHTVPVEIHEHIRAGVRWILLKAAGFFEAGGGPDRSDPYRHDDEHRLLIDSLFFGKAVPYVLAALELRDNVVVQLNDWETTAAAFSVKDALLRRQLRSAVVVLTMHNPYDRGVTKEEMSLVTPRAAAFREPRHTMYQYCLPLVDGPIVTVSRRFAEEFTTDPLQTRFFADHLQDLFTRMQVVGIDNGLFGEWRQPFSELAVEEAALGMPQRILAEKRVRRRLMLDLLSEYTDPRCLGVLNGHHGRPLRELPDEIPVFMMFGRFDPAQKGFDLLLRTIESLPQGLARFVIATIAHDTASPFFADLAEVAERRRGELVVYPFRMEKGYREVLAGASYVVMPSLYEPFGGATEAFLEGTPVVARATGGLAQQVVDLDEHPERGSGFAFRERAPDTPYDWHAIQYAATPLDRMRVPYYGRMVAGLVQSLTRAADLYRRAPAAYASLLAGLDTHAAQFRWEDNLAAYLLVYRAAVRW